MDINPWIAAGVRRQHVILEYLPEEDLALRSTEELDRLNARLKAAYDPDRFVREATAVTELLRRHLTRAACREGPVWPATPPEEQLERWPDPETGPPVAVEELLAEVLAGSTCQHHPGFAGQQLSVPPPLVGPVAMVSAILNNSVAIYEGAPVAVALERRVVSWMARKVGYGEAAGGTLTSGGTLGTLTALLAMRQARVGSDPWLDGLAGDERYAVLVSEEAHYCNRRACAVLGMGEQTAVPVPTDRRFRMTVRALSAVYDQSRKAGRRPVAVIANAGSTSTGSHDDLVALAAFCREHGLWLHVDAAHGGGALLSPRYRPMLRGIEQADSVVWDAHKMMLMPGLCTAVLVRDAGHLDAAFRQEAAYLLSDQEAPWYQPAARNFETTKPAMVLPLYVALRTLGVGFFTDCIEYAYDLARAFAERIDRHEELELLVRPQSNIVCFRRKAPAADSGAVQLALRDAVNRRGRFFIMRTTLRGMVWLRVVLINPATRLDDLEELLEELSDLDVNETRGGTSAVGH